MIVISQPPQGPDGSLKHQGEHGLRKWRCSLRGLHSPEHRAASKSNSAFQNVKGNNSRANTIWCICSLQSLSEPAERERTFQGWNACMPHRTVLSLQALKKVEWNCSKGQNWSFAVQSPKSLVIKFTDTMLWFDSGVRLGFAQEKTSQDVPKTPFKRQLKSVFLSLQWQSSAGLVSAALRWCNSCWVPAGLKINRSKNRHIFVTEGEQSLGQQQSCWRHLFDI